MEDRGDRDRVREATDLVDLIAEVTNVRKSGRTFMAICPFHEEKSPSMSIDRARGLYHCFGCGEGGDVFTFIQKTQGVSFPESLDILARRAGIALTRDPAAARRSGRRSDAVEALQRAIELYHDRLKQAPEAGAARAYLRSRGYEVDVIDQWRLGFSGVEWDTTTRELRAGGIEERALVDAGLSRKGPRGLFDVFRGRLMFPIHDVRGDPVGFGGRRVEGVDPKATNNPEAKYVNSADSIVYQKSRLLFGLDRARKAIAAEGHAVVVEGYTDVIALHLAGVGTAVATCGTALGDDHFDLLRRFTDRVILALDADEAGLRAAMRGDDLDLPFKLAIDLRVAEMPGGLDPADLVQAGRSRELVKAIEDSRPLLEQRIEREVARFDLDGPEGRARALQAAVDLLRRIGNELARHEYARFASRLVGVDLDIVLEAVRKGKVERPPPASRRPGVVGDPFGRELLRVVLANPGAIEVADSDFEDEGLISVYQALAPSLKTGGEADVTGIADPGTREVAMSLILDERPLPELSDVERLLSLRRLEVQIDVLEARLAGLEEGSEAHSSVFRELIALQQERRSLGT